MKKGILISLMYCILLFGCSKVDYSNDLLIPYKNILGFNGFVNKEGITVIRAKYKMVDLFYEGIAVVQKKDNKFYFLKKDGTFLNSNSYVFAHNFSHDKLALVGIRVNDIPKVGYINVKGEIEIECKYDRARPFHDGFAAVATKSGEKYEWYFIDTKGYKIGNNTYKQVGYFSEGLCAVKNWQDEVLFVNNLGKEELKLFGISDVKLFKEGLCVYLIEKKFGFIDRNGKVVIKNIFDEAENFSEGLAAVGTLINGVIIYGYINKKGEYSIRPQFIKADEFYHGYAIVCVENNGKNKFGIINKTGQFVVEPVFEEIYRVEECYVGSNGFGENVFINEDMTLKKF